MSGALRTFFDRISRGYAAPVLRTRDWLYGISDGSVSGKVPLYIWGRKTGLSGSFPTLVATGTSAMPAYPTADQIIKFKSSSANDDGAPAGTGAWTIRIWWLDAAGNESTLDGTLNGTTIVVSAVITMRRVNRAIVLTGTTGVSNLGAISIYGTDGVTVLLQIPVPDTLGCGVSSTTRRTVPIGKRDRIVRILYPLADLTNIAQAILRYRTSPTSPWLMAATLGNRASTPANLGEYLETPITFEAGTDYECVYSGASSEFQVTLIGWTEDA